MCNGSRLLHFFENCGRVSTLRKPLVLVAIFMTLLAEIGAYLITKWHFSLLPDVLVNHLFRVLFVEMSLLVSEYKHIQRLDSNETSW